MCEFTVYSQVLSCSCNLVCVSVFRRDMLLQVLSRSELVVCYKAKDLLRAALQFYKQDLSWKQGSAQMHDFRHVFKVFKHIHAVVVSLYPLNYADYFKYHNVPYSKHSILKSAVLLSPVAGCHIHDPQVSGWLLDPTNPCSCYQDLFNQHCRRACTTPALGVNKVSQRHCRLTRKCISEVHT